MFDLGASEILLTIIVAILVIGPKDLPLALRTAGRWIGRARGMIRQMRSGFDNMVREAELDEMEKTWADQNRRIMDEHRTSSMEPLAPPVLPSGEADPAPDITDPPPPADKPAP